MMKPVPVPASISASVGIVVRPRAAGCVRVAAALRERWPAEEAPEQVLAAELSDVSRLLRCAEVEM